MKIALRISMFEYIDIQSTYNVIKMSILEPRISLNHTILRLKPCFGSHHMKCKEGFQNF